MFLSRSCVWPWVCFSNQSSTVNSWISLFWLNVLFWFVVIWFYFMVEILIWPNYSTMRHKHIGLSLVEYNIATTLFSFGSLCQWVGLQLPYQKQNESCMIIIWRTCGWEERFLKVKIILYVANGKRVRCGRIIFSRE